MMVWELEGYYTSDYIVLPLLWPIDNNSFLLLLFCFQCPRQHAQGGLSKGSLLSLLPDRRAPVCHSNLNSRGVVFVMLLSIFDDRPFTVPTRSSYKAYVS